MTSSTPEAPEPGTQVEWVWMGHAGHFIGSQDCQFHLNTYVNGYIVSTIGEYLPKPEPRRSDWHEIGYGRTYETFVFTAEPGELECCPWVASNWSEIDSRGYTDVGEASRGHLEMCRDYTARQSPTVALTNDRAEERER